MPASPAEYRRHAAECLELAERISEPTDKTRLITMAQSFLELAHKLEFLESSSKGRAKEKESARRRKINARVRVLLKYPLDRTVVALAKV